MNTIGINKSLMQDIILVSVEMEELCPEIYLFLDETPQLRNEVTEKTPSTVALQDYLETLKCQLLKYLIVCRPIIASVE
ncbi:hypothetical protein C3K47_12940 [Solitalea longa]|uniref:Uncharacterized protein n=1 Tax=Solitalea longa TaxID=2079460 RepID=A0A2S5A0H9_9SPHI|nr:hypothetical protein [Solitalea longa]POY36098.1 hypothetical protein C3K47_12940 [Solitalea longa]